MTNTVHDIYVLKAFGALVYKEMREFLNDYIRKFINYSKIEDEIDRIGLHDTVKKTELELRAQKENEELNDTKGFIYNYLLTINEKSVLDTLIKSIKEEYSSYDDKIILNNLEDIFKQRTELFQIQEKIKTVINYSENKCIEILDEGVNQLEEDIIANCHIGIISSSFNSKNELYKKILGILKNSESRELREFGILIKETKNIDAEFHGEQGMNLYSFAIINGYDEIAELIMNYKTR